MDLNTRVAEAQGWVIMNHKVMDMRCRVSEQIVPCWFDTDSINYQGVVEDYKPSTDLNQAVAFAQWGFKEEGFCCDWDGEKDPWVVNGVKNSKDYFGQADTLAKALCLATLKSLSK